MDLGLWENSQEHASFSLLEFIEDKWSVIFFFLSFCIASNDLCCPFDIISYTFSFWKHKHLEMQTQLKYMDLQLNVLCLIHIYSSLAEYQTSILNITCMIAVHEPGKKPTSHDDYAHSTKQKGKSFRIVNRLQALLPVEFKSKNKKVIAKGAQYF